MQRRSSNRLNFTKSAIDKMAAPEGKRAYHYDDKIPGLAVCVTSSSTKTFYVVRRVDHKVEFIRIGGWPEYTVEMARDEASRINGKVAEGVNPNDERRQNRQVRTLREAYDAYVLLPTRTKSKRPRSPKTLKEYKLQFEGYLDHWRHRRLNQINRADVEALHNKLGTENGHYAANRTLTLLRAIYNAEIDAGYSGGNPTAGIAKFEEHDRERFVQADEFPEFWKALEAEPSQKVRDAVLLSLFTGQRKTNVMEMRWADVNLERAVWTIPQTKQRKPHDVPLTPPALEILRRRLGTRDVDGPADPNNPGHRMPSEHVFPGLHGCGHLKDIYRAWYAILERAGIDNLRIHDLRRSMGSWQSMTGSVPQIVGRTLGQSQVRTTQIYARVNLDPVRQSMIVATETMLALAKPKEKAGKRSRKESD